MPQNSDDLPIADLQGIDDGWGVVGAALECTKCGEDTLFVWSWKGAIVTCQWCEQDHYVDKDYDY
jgi:hypothetical protein